MAQPPLTQLLGTEHFYAKLHTLIRHGCMAAWLPPLSRMSPCDTQSCQHQRSALSCALLSHPAFDLGVTRTINFGFFHSCNSWQRSSQSLPSAPFNSQSNAYTILARVTRISSQAKLTPIHIIGPMINGAE
jgi:hypothetical protein